MKNHTKGEWLLTTDKPIGQKDADWFIHIQGRSNNIARVIKTFGMTEEEYKANAQVIQAAPAMYEALVVIREHLISSTEISRFTDKNNMIVPKTDMLLYIEKILGYEAVKESSDHPLATDHNQEIHEGLPKDQQEAKFRFEQAITQGHLSTDDEMSNYVNNFMYMGTQPDGTVMFKHINTRSYRNYKPSTTPFYEVREHNGTEILSFVRKSDGCYFEKGREVSIKFGNTFLAIAVRIEKIVADEQSSTGMKIVYDGKESDCSLLVHVEPRD